MFFKGKSFLASKEIYNENIFYEHGNIKVLLSKRVFTKLFNYCNFKYFTVTLFPRITRPVGKIEVADRINSYLLPCRNIWNLSTGGWTTYLFWFFYQNFSLKGIILVFLSKIFFIKKKYQYILFSLSSFTYSLYLNNY